MAKRPAAASKPAVPVGPSLLDRFTAAKNAPAASAAKTKDDTVWHIFLAAGLMLDVILVGTIKWAMNALKVALETREKGLKDAAIAEYFIPQGIATKEQPPNIKITSDNFVIGIQLRKKSEREALTEADVEILEKLGIPTKEKILVPAGLMIDEKHLTEEVLVALQDLIAANPDRLPADLITVQEKKSCTVVTDESIAAMWKLKEKEVGMALPILTTMAMTYGAAPVGEKHFDMLEDILFPEPTAA